MSELQNDLSFKKEADSAAQSADVESGNSVVVESTAIKPLQRGLNARHITIISFGGVIGTGIFLSVGSALAQAGPAMLTAAFVAYSIIMWTIAQAVGEMGTYLPIEGTFITWANRYINRHVGFTVGWNFYYTKTVICCAQISAVTGMVQFWAPNTSPAIIVSASLVLAFLLNAVGPGRYGEFEFWFSILKIFLILGLLLMTVVLMSGGNPNHDAFGFRYWKTPGPAKTFVADGSLGYFLAFWSMFKTAAFTIGGPDFIAITSAETINPRRLVPKCTNRVVYRICFLFILSVICIGILCPYNDPELLKQLKIGHGVAYSPWVVGMYKAGLNPVLPNIMNAVVMISAASCGNADMYMSTRALHALAINGHAPKIFAKTLKNGCPLPALLMTLAFCSMTYMTVSQGSSAVFTVFTSLSAIGVMINYMWMLVSWICFRKAMKVQNVPVGSLPFQGLATPWGPRIALSVVVLIIITNGFNIFCTGRWTVTGFLGAYFGIIWTAALYLGYYIVVRPKSGIPACNVDLISGKAEIDADEEYWKINRPLPVTAWQKFLEWLF